MKKILLIVALLNTFALSARADRLYYCGRINCPLESAADPTVVECKLDEPTESIYIFVTHKLPYHSFQQAAKLHGQCACVTGYSSFFGQKDELNKITEITLIREENNRCVNPGLPGFDGNSTSNGDLGGMGGGFNHM